MERGGRMGRECEKVERGSVSEKVGGGREEVGREG